MADTTRLEDLEASERVVLGSMLVDLTIAHEIAGILRTRHFSSPSHQFLFDTIRQKLENNEELDLVVLVEHLRKTRQLRRARGEGYVMSLVDQIASPVAARHHAQIVLERARRQDLLKLANSLSEAARNGKELPEIIDDAEKALFQIGVLPSSSAYRAMSEVMPSVMLALEPRIEHKLDVIGLPSGYPDLDNLTLGFQRGDLVVVGARAGVGKTSFCLNLARNIASQGRPVGFVSLEMSEQAVTERLLAIESGLDSRDIRRGKIYGSQVKELVSASGRLAGYPIHIDDGPDQSPFAIRAKARRLMAETRGQLAALFVDYLQLMDCGSISESSHQAIGGAARSLKTLAKELKIPLFLISQLKRPPMQQEDRPPYLTDLKESGDIENHADVVIFLHRPGLAKHKEKDPGLTEIRVAKQRMGPTGRIKLMHLLPQSQFRQLSARSGLDKEQPPPPF